MAEKLALVVIDLQNDFTPGGSLAVPDGDQVVPVMNLYVEKFRKAGLSIYASRDWHPPVTKHFKEYGGLWPPHCVQETHGAEFHPDLRLPPEAVVVSKGMDPRKDSYSAFDAFESDGTPFVDSLRQRGIETLSVGGLASDYCVKWTVLEGLLQGFGVTLLIDGSLGVNLQPHDSERAIADMVRAGALVATIDQAISDER